MLCRELERECNEWKANAKSLLRSLRDEEAKAEANERDKSRMDYLERNVVTVAAPLVYGSRSLFCCGPDRDDCFEELPSSIRKYIDTARSAEKEKE